MKVGTVSSLVLATTGTWNVAYNLAVVEWLRAHQLDDTPEHIVQAMRTLAMDDAGRYERATALRKQAEQLLEEARELESWTVHTRQQVAHMKG